MNPVLGWALAALSVVAGWVAYGWGGVVLAVSATVFWLLLQFSRALRAMQHAGRQPVGRIDSAVMFQARLTAGLTMLQIVGLTKSLGRQVGDARGAADLEDRWRWTDAGGNTVTLRFVRGRLQHWQLERSAETQDSAP